MAAIALPLTERVLDRLGRRRLLWIVAWSLVPLISWLAFATAIRLSGRPLEVRDAMDLATTQVVLAYAVLVLLTGTGILARQAQTVARDVDGLLAAPLTSPLFARLGSTVGPVSLTAAAAAVVTAGGMLQYGALPPLVALPVLVVYLLPILTFFWVFTVVLAEVDRLGRQPLRLDAFPEDRTLGLGNVGSLASTGLGLLLASAVPVMLVGADEPVTLGVSLVIVAVTVAIFVLSMWRLHGQMATAKARHVALARKLYGDAYGPVRENPTLAVLETRASALDAAAALDDRAHGLPTWPIDENTSRFMVVIVTGVVTSLVVRGLFAALGE